MNTPSNRSSNINSHQPKRNQALTLRKHNSLPIQRPSVGRNALPSKALLDMNPSRLIKANATQLHNTIDLPLSRLVQAAPAVPGLDVLRQIEIRAVQPGLGILGEGRRLGQTDVAVAADEAGDVAGDVVEPVGDVAGCG
jgi:hypothetical protein